MKANEFVRVFGWGKAKEVSSFTSNVCEDPTHFDSDLDIYVHFDDFNGVMDESDVCIHDLKCLIESHDFIESLGGYQFVKENLPSGYFGEGGYKDLIQKCLEDMEIANENTH